jgi:hypothetical protein
LADAVQQRRMAGRVGDIESAGQDRDRDPVGGECGPVRRTVDPVGAAGDHRDIAFGQAGRQFVGHMLAVRRRSSGADESARAPGHLVETSGAHRPQRHWCHQLNTVPRPGADTAEGGEREPRPLVIVRRDEAAAAPR